ncbi:hypothetical protein [Gemmatimonas sp.]|uniref:hypothetical protein n=1 Tax=Gemmatimonas sp. TaxID=1962908 RepID=UPI003566402D
MPITLSSLMMVASSMRCTHDDIVQIDGRFTQRLQCQLLSCQMLLDLIEAA